MGAERQPQTADAVAQRTTRPHATRGSDPASIGDGVFIVCVKIVVARLVARVYIQSIEANNPEQDEMITIDREVIEQIKAEAAEFGFQANEQSIARDYFARMSYEDKAVVMAANSGAKGVTALSRACVDTIAQLIAA